MRVVVKSSTTCPGIPSPFSAFSVVLSESAKNPILINARSSGDKKERSEEEINLCK